MTAHDVVMNAGMNTGAAVIRAKLMADDEWLRRGIVAIYNYQTQLEQTTEQTRDDNGVGFNGVDAELLTSFAKQILKGSLLSPKQLGIARKKMPKYAGQLWKIAHAKQ